MTTTCRHTKRVVYMAGMAYSHVNTQIAIINNDALVIKLWKHALTL